MDNWQYVEGSSVPTIIIERMQREEPSTAEKTQTDHIVPDTDRGFEENQSTSIEELLTSAEAEAESSDNPGITSTNQYSPLAEGESSISPEHTDSDRDTTYEMSSSGMFPLNEPTAFEEADKLSFLMGSIQASQNQDQSYSMDVQATEEQPFIRVEHGADFADSLHPDFFPRTFPKLFPWGRGGPKAITESSRYLQHSSNHSLEYWARYVLQRHGGRFASHPVFCFLVFNILLRSSNRRISMLRMTKGSFERVERACASLTVDQLKRAEDEMREKRATTDPDISLLLRELSIFGHAHPLSNESRLLMRRKIQALCVRTGMPAIWFTINPNDINNPVKMRLAIHRLHDYDRAEELLANLQEMYDKIALSIMDPVSSAIFFYREVSLFFEKYVRAGQESVFGKISHYYATVETNDRGSLHLHGLLWLDGNMQLPSLIDDMANPEEGEYRSQVIRYLDSVFHECLDEDTGKAIRQERKPIHPVEGMIKSTEAFSAAFDDESNYIAYCCQIHSHTYTCVKYSLKRLAEQGVDKHSRTACRFKVPWKIIGEMGFTDEGLLKIRRNHPLVNRYNKAMAVGLRHNHDISAILTKTKGLAMIYYITNYATKLETPMWKRLALAAEVFRQLESAIPSPSDSAEHGGQQRAVLNKSRQFLMRVANRIFSERQISAVEVCYHLLNYHTDFTNVPNWSFLHLNTLYWAIFRRWSHLRRQAGMETDAEEPPETVNLKEGGRKLSYFDAYAYRGRLLRDLCFYDYMSMINLVRLGKQGEDKTHIAFEKPSQECCSWIPKLRQPHEYAVPIFQGFISDDHKDEHPIYFKRYVSEYELTSLFYV